jgi:hypothetical protein
MRVCGLLLVLSMSAAPAAAQSLYLHKGERAVEATGGWSVGPSSNGEELVASVGLDGRVDAGIGIARYTYSFDDGTTSTFKEYAPFVRVFPVKQGAGGAPISLSLNGQFFVDDYGTSDSGHYVQVGTTIYRDVKVTDNFSIQPYGGFAFVAESYTFGGGPAATAQYLTRDLGVHFSTSPSRPWIVKATLSEQSFRRETYRQARISVIRRLP